MNNRYLRWVKGACMCTAIVAGLYSCADDHFDINPEVSGLNTLWENISSNENLSEFADLLQRVNYSKSEGITTVETYADLFNGNQTFTVWAPQNGTFEYAKYDALLKTGDPADAYIVEQQLIRNSMTRFNHVLTGGDSVSLQLFNSKNAVFNCAKSTMKGQQIVTPNIGSTNGVLHVVDGAVAYQRNMYEFLSTRADLDSINTFIKKFQKLEFNESLSTQGPTIDGHVTWVDSIFVTTNDYISSIRAYLTSEDSSYAMVIPTNDAWTAALARTKTFYNYKAKYSQTVATTTPEGKDTLIKGVETLFSQEELDSIVNFRSKNAIVQNLVFNTNSQWGRDHTQFGVEGACDSLMTTSRQVFYDPFSARLFDNSKPVAVSNGYAYVVNNFNYRAEDSWASEMIYETENMQNVESADASTIASTSAYSLSMSYSPDDVQQKDTTFKYTAYVLSPKSSSVHPGATFMLRDVLSCKYDIYVLVGYNMTDNKPNKFQVTLAYDTEQKRVNNERLKNPLEDSEYYNTTYFVNREPGLDANGQYQIIDSVLVAKDFEFPICYEGLENAYVTLTVKSSFKSNEKLNFSRELWIDKIILKAKEE